MDWSAPIDLYCERAGTGLWSEPLNAWSNLAFPLAALYGAYVARARGQLRPVVVVLLGLAALIGLGSWLFHVFANGWSEYADVIPIWSFVALYVLAAVHLLGGVAPGKLLRIVAAVAAAIVVLSLATSTDAGAEAAADPLNGSGQYLPALVALCVFAVLSWQRRHPIRGWALAATAVFAMSLVLRTVDLRFCALLPMGTHFMWHILNGAMVGLLLQGLIRTMPARE